jgi:hypothetical protein
MLDGAPKFRLSVASPRGDPFRGETILLRKCNEPLKLAEMRGFGMPNARFACSFASK